VAYKIVSKEQLSEDVFTAEIEAPLVTRARKPGQFVIVGISGEYSERIPLTIAGSDADKGTIRLIWQRVGKSTAEMADIRMLKSSGPLYVWVGGSVLRRCFPSQRL